MLNIIKIFFFKFLNFLVLLNFKVNQLVKVYHVFSEEDSVNNNYESFRGLYFESDNSIRVVSFKVKINLLKLFQNLLLIKFLRISVKFKIKFIWYGDISLKNLLWEEETLN